MGAVVLIIVMWANGTAPDVQAFVTKDRASCEALAESFIEAEEVANDSGPYPIRDHYAVACETWNGNDMGGA